MAAVGERDWSAYNDALVRRGYIGIHPLMLEEWRRELKRENRGKVGLPYRYPESFVRLIAYMRTIFHLPYRQAEGFVLFLSEHIEGLSVPDYSTIARRTNRLHLSLDDSIVRSHNPVSIAVDASGIKVHNGGDWIRSIWRARRKGYLKFHIAVDIRTGQIVSMDVSSEKVSDGRRMTRLVRRAQESVRVKRVLGDGAYDTKANFNFLSEREGNQASHQGGEELLPEEQGLLGEEDGRGGAADVQAKGLVKDTQVRVQVESGGGLLVREAHLRGVRVREKVS